MWQISQHDQMLQAMLSALQITLPGCRHLCSVLLDKEATEVVVWLVIKVLGGSIRAEGRAGGVGDVSVSAVRRIETYS